jgi:hypothetical protein
VQDLYQVLEDYQDIDQMIEVQMDLVMVEARLRQVFNGQGQAYLRTRGRSARLAETSTGAGRAAWSCRARSHCRGPRL